MPNLLRNALAIIAGFITGSIVNMALIMLSPSLIPPPAGINLSDPDSMRASIHLLEARHFVMPFLAHALGTLVGAAVAYLIAATHRARMGYAIGVLFLLGGVAASFMIPAPVWFIALDLLLAYIPMAWLGVRIGERLSSGRGIAQPRVA